MVVWITGMSGAGKTTLSLALAEVFRGGTRRPVILDGDSVRNLFGDSLGHSEAERVVQINRLQRLASFLEAQGVTVIVAALYAHRDLLRWNRENFAQYYEVYIQAPMDLLVARDSKGLYQQAGEGEPSDVVGMDIPWNEPEQPDMKVDAAAGEDAASIARRLAVRLNDLELARPGI